MDEIIFVDNKGKKKMTLKGEDLLMEEAVLVSDEQKKETPDEDAES